MKRSSILFFVKYPEIGSVKTRLASAVGDEAAMKLYQCFVLELMHTLKRCGYAYRICFSPAEAAERMAGWLGSANEYRPQRGDGLGERMKNAFLEIFAEGVERAILIGSDSPDMTIDILDEAFRSLESNDVVLGSALDGGYYLIGFNAHSFLPEVFDAIEWSTDTVYEKTIEVLRKAGQRVHCLPPLLDIDELKDLNEYASKNTRTGHVVRKIINEG